ncbi:hypothetical protein ACNKHU_16070 [Shigella flexneri]
MGWRRLYAQRFRCGIKRDVDHHVLVYGAEIVTIAAAESDTPEKHIVRATNWVISRISIFYLCSIFVVVALIPWNMPN